MNCPLENMHFVQGKAPVADALAGTVGSDVVNCENAHWVCWVLQKGVGTTGTSTITVEACDDVTPSNTAAIPFFYRNVTTGDTATALTAATTAGFTTTAGSAHMVLVAADCAELAASGYGYMRLKAVEVVDDPVLAGILCFLTDLRFSEVTGRTAIV
jgi:hypothetical protein